MAEQGEGQGTGEEPRPPNTPSLDHRGTGGTFREGQDVEKGEVITRSTREKNGRFANPWPTWHYPSSASLLRFYLIDKDHSNVPRSKEELDCELPVLEPYFIQSPEVSGSVGSGLRVTWLGHASVLVEMDGLVILTDPIFSQRAFLVQFMGPKRFRGPPCTVDQLPKVDAVLVSHTHYDHLDVGSVSSLNKRFGAELRWFVPLGLQGWMQSCGCKNVIELDWWEESCVPVPSPVPSGVSQDKVMFVFTPAQHWCKRTPTDDNRVLWGSWCVLGPCNRFFFAGDTGYCSSFQEIGRRFGPFHLAAIPIGAYLPRDVMKSLHVDPEEAVEIHKDVKAKHSLAIHWGTFALAHEYYLEPPVRLREAMEKNGLNAEHFFVLNHGESRELGGEREGGGV